MAALLVVPSVLGAAALLAARHRRDAIAPIAVSALTASLALGTWAAVTSSSVAWRWGPGLELGLAVTGLGRVMVVLVPAVAIPVVAFAGSSLRHDRGLVRLMVLLQAFVGAMLLLVAAGDLLTLLVGWELVSVCSLALIGHQWRDRATTDAATQAFLTTRVGDVGLVAAAGVALAAGAGTRYEDLAALSGWPAQVAALGLLVAAAAKSAQLPFAPWLFSAMAGPTPVSALLHSATMVAAGAYVLARTVPELDGAAWLPDSVAALGVATAIAGGVVASVQTDLKRALAGSTSAQYGLVLVAVGAGSSAAAGAHLVTHAVFKALLFLAAGVALHAAGTLQLGGLRLGRALPGIALGFGVGALALAAVPPTGGAWSKEEILAAAAHEAAWLTTGVALATFLTALYAGRLMLLAFGPGARRAADGGPTVVERMAIGGLAVATVGLAVLWLPGADDLVERATGGLLIAGRWWELPLTVALLATAGGVVLGLDRGGLLLTLGLPRSVQSFIAGWYGLPLLARIVVVDPTLAAARTLAAIDDRVVDAGVRAAARVPAAASRALAWWGERGVDGAVLGVATGTLRAAGASRTVDERGVDRAVEEVAQGTGAAARHIRRLQTGLTHHYYVVAAVGLLVVVAVATLGR